MQNTLAKALRDLSELNSKLHLLQEQFNDELTVEVSVEEYNNDPIAVQAQTPHRPEKNLVEIRKIMQQIGQLKIRIQLTNVHTEVTYDGEKCTLAELLLLYNDLKAQRNLVKSLCSRSGGGSRRYMLGRGDEQTKILLDYDVDKMREDRDRLISEINKLDLFIQDTNFRTELIR